MAAVATAAFREAQNGREVVEIGRRLQIPVEIATEQRESALAYLTATDGLGNRAVVDYGSRSIELVSQDDRGTPRWKVIDFGYRAAYERFFAKAPTFDEAYRNMAAALARECGDLAFFAGREEFVGIELDEAAKYVLRTKKIDGARITLAVLRTRIEKLRAETARKFSRLKELADMDRVLPRMVALEYILETARYPSVRVVERELGVGLIIEAGSK